MGGVGLDALKTLKDFDCSCEYTGICGCKNKNQTIVRAEYLRLEAIKWVKEISKGGFKKTPEVKIIDGRLDISEVSTALLTQETDLVARWIIHFFGLSEEDLK